MSTPDLDTLLRTLDPASSSIDAQHRARAAQRLDRIVATRVPAPSPSRGRALRPSRSPRLVRQVAAVAAVGAVVAGAAVVVPGFLGTQMAYASWTVSASDVAGADLTAAVSACREQLDGYPARAGEIGAHFNPATIPLALADRRGQIVSVIFQQERPEDVSAMCLATVPSGSGKATDVETSVGGSSGPAWVPDAGRIAEGSMSGYGDAAWQVSGAVGDGVTGVTIHLGDGVVEATVKGHRYTAWGPGQAFTNLGGASGQGGPRPRFTYDVHLADGTVQRTVEPARPS